MYLSKQMLIKKRYILLSGFNQKNVLFVYKPIIKQYLVFPPIKFYIRLHTWQTLIIIAGSKQILHSKIYLYLLERQSTMSQRLTIIRMILMLQFEVFTKLE